MPLTYRCELYVYLVPDCYATSECPLDKDGCGPCGDENIKRDCMWGRWATKGDEEFREYVKNEIDHIERVTSVYIDGVLVDELPSSFGGKR